MPAASRLVAADGPVADSPGKAVLGALAAGADTRARQGGPVAAVGAAALEAAAALIKLWLKSGLQSVEWKNIRTAKTQ